MTFIHASVVVCVYLCVQYMTFIAFSHTISLCKLIYIYSSLIGLVLSPISTKSAHPTGLSLCYSINAVTSVLHAYISGIDTSGSPGSVLNLLAHYNCVHNF